MPRLPIIASDGHAWGTVLNEYLTVSHGADGTLKDAALGNYLAKAGGTLTGGIDLTLTRGNGLPATTYAPLDLLAHYTTTDKLATDNPYHGLRSTLYYGGAGSPGVAATGTVHASTFQTVVRGNALDLNEHAALFAVLRYDIGTGYGAGGLGYGQAAGPAGRGWMADFSIHGPIGVQPHLLSGITQFVNNYYNGQPFAQPSYGIAVVTVPNGGGAKDATHGAATTYPVDAGVHVAGTASGTAVGFNRAFLAGGTGTGWNISASKIGIGFEARDFVNYGLYIHDRATGATGPAIAVSANGGRVLIGTATAARSAELEVLAPASLGGIEVQGSGGNALVVRRNDGASIIFANEGGVTINSALPLIFSEGSHLQLGAATGTKLGTAATQKLALWNATPIVQPVGIVDADGTLIDITAKFNSLIGKLEAFGLLAVA